MICQLKDICTFLSGYAWSASEFTDSGIPVIRINNLSSKKTEFQHWSGDYDRKYIIQNGDLLVSLSGTIKVHKWTGENALLNQRIVKITANPDINQDWVYYQILYVIDRIANKGKHAIIKNVSIVDLTDFEIDLPDIETQNKAAEVLNMALGLVQNRERTISYLDKLLDSQFLEMFQEDLLKIDKKKKALSDIATIVSGFTLGRKTKETNVESLPYLRVANTQDGYFNLEEIKETEVTLIEKERYNILKRDLLITEGGDPDKLGRGAIWEGEENKFIYQNHLYRIRLIDKSKFSAYWLIYLIGSKYGKNYFQSRAKQTTGIATINKRDVSSFPIPVSPINLQKEFEEKYLRIKSSQAKLLAEQKELNDLFNSIIQRAFTGKLNFNISIEVDALLGEIDSTKLKNDLLSIVTNEEYLLNLVDRLNNQNFKTQSLYDKAKSVIFQLLKEDERVAQKFNSRSKNIKLVVK